MAEFNASFFVKTIMFSELKMNIDTNDNTDVMAEIIKIRVMIIVNATKNAGV